MVLGLESTLILELLLLGAGAGFLAGLLGVGGGMLLVPLLALVFERRDVLPDHAIKMAIATSMAIILFTSLSSLRAHHRRGAVRWDFVRGLAPGIVAGGLAAGAGAFAALKGAWITLLFAIFVAFSATQMLRGIAPRPGRRVPGRAGLALAGGTIGFLSGLVGVGGAFATVPFLTWCNVSAHRAVATSAALGFPIAAAGTLGYLIGGWTVPAALPATIGFFYLPAVVLVAAASTLSAPAGAHIAHAMDVARLRRVFALLLYGLAAYMLYKSFGH